MLALAGWLVDRRRRAYADLPTSPTAAVFAGRNEVKGRAWSAEPVRAHATGTAAVWWDWCLEEERRHTRTVSSSDGRGGTTTRTETYTQWHQVDRRADAVGTFEVVDATGSVPVDLDGAKVVPRQTRQRTFRPDDDRGFLSKVFDNRTGRYRETERAVAVGDELFVVGEARLDDATCVPVLGGRALVSTRSEESHTGWLGAGVGALVLAAMGCAVAAVALWRAPDDPLRPMALAPGVALALVVLAGAWAVTVHNRLRLLAQGVDRAWSLIDVQLQRRHDLVPALVTAVTAAAEHEQGVLASLSAARWRAGTARAADELAAEAGEQTVALRQVLAVAERHPELGADASFLRLQRELADAETRIAGSRTFYNDSLTLLRDRSRAFPGLLVARWIPLGHRDHLRAEGFERTVPPVERVFSP